jgi:hypothetical protein
MNRQRPANILPSVQCTNTIGAANHLCAKYKTNLQCLNIGSVCYHFFGS